MLGGAEAGVQQDSPAASRLGQHAGTWLSGQGNSQPTAAPLQPSLTANCPRCLAPPPSPESQQDPLAAAGPLVVYFQSLMLQRGCCLRGGGLGGFGLLKPW